MNRAISLFLIISMCASHYAMASKEDNPFRTSRFVMVSRALTHCGRAWQAFTTLSKPTKGMSLGTALFGFWGILYVSGRMIMNHQDYRLGKELKEYPDNPSAFDPSRHGENTFLRLIDSTTQNPHLDTLIEAMERGAFEGHQKMTQDLSNTLLKRVSYRSKNFKFDPERDKALFSAIAALHHYNTPDSGKFEALWEITDRLRFQLQGPLVHDALRTTTIVTTTKEEAIRAGRLLRDVLPKGYSMTWLKKRTGHPFNFMSQEHRRAFFEGAYPNDPKDGWDPTYMADPDLYDFLKDYIQSADQLENADNRRPQ